MKLRHRPRRSYTGNDNLFFIFAGFFRFLPAINRILVAAKGGPDIVSRLVGKEHPAGLALSYLGHNQPRLDID